MSYIKYLLKDANAETAKFDSRIKDFRELGFIYTQSGNHVLITDSKSIDDKCFESDATEVSDGLLFYKPVLLPSLESICVNKSPSIDLLLSTKKYIKIAPCIFQARALVFNRGQAQVSDSFTTEYGKLGYTIYKGLRDSPDGDQWIIDNENLIARFIYLAVTDNYRITSELINCYELFTADDVQRLVLAGCGVNLDEEQQKKT